MPGGQRQLRQFHLGQVTFERADQAERPCRPVQVAFEGALIIAIAIMHLGIETLEGNLGRCLQWVQAQPREVLPVQLRIGGQALLPVGRGLQFHALGVAGGQVKGIEPGAFAVDQPGQRQRDWRLFSRQAGRSRQLITLEQVALGIKLELIQLQGIGQRARRLERL